MNQYQLGSFIFIESERIFGRDSLVVLKKIIGNEVKAISHKLEIRNVVIEIFNTKTGYKIIISVEAENRDVRVENKGGHLYELIAECFLGVREELDRKVN